MRSTVGSPYYEQQNISKVKNLKLSWRLSGDLDPVAGPMLRPSELPRLCVISGFRREVLELRCSGLLHSQQRKISYRRFGKNYRFHLRGLTEEGTDRLSRNIGKEFVIARCAITHNSAVLF